MNSSSSDIESAGINTKTIRRRKSSRRLPHQAVPKRRHQSRRFSSSSSSSTSTDATSSSSRSESTTESESSHKHRRKHTHRKRSSRLSSRAKARLKKLSVPCSPPVPKRYSARIIRGEYVSFDKLTINKRTTKSSAKQPRKTVTGLITWLEAWN